LRLGVKATGLLDELPKLGILGCEGITFGDGLFECTHDWIRSFCVGRKHGFERELWANLG